MLVRLTRVHSRSHGLGKVHVALAKLRGLRLSGGGVDWTKGGLQGQRRSKSPEEASRSKVYRCLRQTGGNFPVCLQIVVERLATQSGSRVSVQRVPGRSIEMIRTTVAHLKASNGGGKVSAQL